MKLFKSDVKTKEVLDWKGIHLLNFKFSACSTKARIYMNLKKISYHSHQINLSKGENFSEWFQGINPRSLVPVLIHNGEVHIESNDILLYLEDKFEANPLIPVREKDEVEKLLKFEDDLHTDIRNVTFKFIVPKFLNKGHLPQPKSKNKATLHGKEDILDDTNRDYWHEYEKSGIKDTDVRISLKRLKDALNEIDKKLADNEFILGLSISLIDIAWFIYVSRLKDAKYPLGELHPNVARWYESLIRIDEFSREIKKPLIMKFIINMNNFFLNRQKKGIRYLL
mgnify:FL=1